MTCAFHFAPCRPLHTWANIFRRGATQFTHTSSFMKFKERIQPVITDPGTFFFLTILLPVCCRPALAGKLFQGWALVRVWAVWSWVAPLAGNTNTPARSLVHSLRLGTSIWSGGRQPTGSSDCRSSSLLLARVSHLRPLHFFPLGDGMRIGREKEREKKQPPPQKRKTRQDTTACETKKKKTTEFVREEPRKRIEKESIHRAILFVMETAKVERGDGRYGCVTLGRTEVWNVPKQPSVRQ